MTLLPELLLIQRRHMPPLTGLAVAWRRPRAGATPIIQARSLYEKQTAWKNKADGSFHDFDGKTIAQMGGTDLGTYKLERASVRSKPRGG